MKTIEKIKSLFEGKEVELTNKEFAGLSEYNFFEWVQQVEAYNHGILCVLDENVFCNGLELEAFIADVSFIIQQYEANGLTGRPSEIVKMVEKLLEPKIVFFPQVSMDEMLSKVMMEFHTLA